MKSKQPGDLRNRQIVVGQITPGEINFETFQDVGKTQTFRGEPSRKCTLTKAESAGDRGQFGVTMW